MSRKKLAVPWMLFSITAIVCIALTVIIVVQDKEPGEQPANQNTTENSSPNFQDYSDYGSISRGYYMRADSGASFIFLEGDSENDLTGLHTKDDMMFSELMNGDVIIFATDEVMDASYPPTMWVYKCVRIDKGTKDRKSLPEIQEAIKGQEEEFGYTFEDNWRE